MRKLILLGSIILSLAHLSAQNVGIGTTVPKSKMDVNGGITVGSGYAGATAAPTDGAIIKGRVGIGNSNPGVSAILDLTNTGNMGLVLPTMSTRPATPTAGMVIYNTSNNCLEFYANSAWQNIICPCSAAPSAPAAPTGTNTNLCTGSSNVYSIAAVSGATSYNWTGPTGSSINGGGNTLTGSTSTSVTMVMGSSTTGGLTAQAVNNCGTSASSSALALSFAATLGTPSISPTSATICASSAGNIFTVTQGTGAAPTTYSWSAPAGCVINGGTNTLANTTATSVTITFGTTAGNVSVTANNCGGTPSTAATSAVSFYSTTLPSISGPTVVGANQSSVTYTIATVTGASNYSWAATTGGNGTSSSTGTTGSVSWSGNTVGTAAATTTVKVNVTICGTVYPQTLNVVAGGKTKFYCINGSTVPGGGDQTFTTGGQTSLAVKLWGAGGSGTTYSNASGGSGGYVAGTLTVSASTAYKVIVGMGGYHGRSTTNSGTMYGGGGADGLGSTTSSDAGCGGGRSAIQLNSGGGDLVTAGGGGGGGGYGGSHGGAGGGTTGGSGAGGYSGYNPGTGGAQASTTNQGCGPSSTYCGANGTLGQGGYGVSCSCSNDGGGGGGGYWGGGGGAGDEGAGGGGGSSYVTNAAFSMTANTQGTVSTTGGVAAAPYTDSDLVANPNSTPNTTPCVGGATGDGGPGEVVIAW